MVVGQFCRWIDTDRLSIFGTRRVVQPEVCSYFAQGCPSIFALPNPIDVQGTQETASTEVVTKHRSTEATPPSKTRHTPPPTSRMRRENRYIERAGMDGLVPGIP